MVEAERGADSTLWVLRRYAVFRLLLDESEDAFFSVIRAQRTMLRHLRLLQ